jgi:asparagine synthase (glutamine-hydrolysing)
MNLFIVKKGNYAATASDLLSALASDALHSQLAEGHESDQWESPCASLAFACVHEGPGRAAPRRYVHHDSGSIATFDGLPVDAKGRFRAHVAADIATYWEQFDADVDGFYGALKIDKKSLRLEVQTDLFGVYKVYSWTDGKSWLISNSIAAIDSLVNGLGFDDVAMSLFICTSWVPGTYTLLEGIRCVEPGTRLVWGGSRPEPDTRTIAKASDFLRDPPEKITSELVNDLSTELLSVCESIGEHFSEVLCPLTGGKDSRLLAVLLHAAGVPARSYTYGNALGTDGLIATQVAAQLGIEHENILTNTGVLFSRWDKLSADFIRRGSGLCPLQLITGSVTADLVNTQSKPLRLWGAGSSICRAPFFEPLDYIRNTDLRSVTRRLSRTLVKNYGGLLRPEALADANEYIAERLKQFDGEGISPLDMPDVFWIYERGSARSGKNMRVTMNYRDTYSPFFAKSFAQASFALSALQRATEPLHYKLLEKMFPEVCRIPFDKGAWKPQNEYINLTRELGKAFRFRGKLFIRKRLRRARPIQPKHMLVKDTMFERVHWLKMLVGDMREQINDPSNSEIWNVVNRDKFMQVTSDSSDEQALALNAVPLFTIATVLAYKNERNSGN